MLNTNESGTIPILQKILKLNKILDSGVQYYQTTDDRYGLEHEGGSHCQIDSMAAWQAGAPFGSHFSSISCDLFYRTEALRRHYRCGEEDASRETWREEDATLSSRLKW